MRNFLVRIRIRLGGGEHCGGSFHVKGANYEQAETDALDRLEGFFPVLKSGVVPERFSMLTIDRGPVAAAVVKCEALTSLLLAPGVRQWVYDFPMLAVLVWGVVIMGVMLGVVWVGEALGRHITVNGDLPSASVDRASVDSASVDSASVRQCVAGEAIREGDAVWIKDGLAYPVARKVEGREG